MDLRQASSCEELISPQIQHMPLHHAAAGDTTVLHHAPVAVLLAVLLASLDAQNILILHYPQAGAIDQTVGRHYTRFRGNVDTAEKENQQLGRRPRLPRGLNQGRIREVRLNQRQGDREQGAAAAGAIAGDGRAAVKLGHQPHDVTDPDQSAACRRGPGVARTRDSNNRPRSCGGMGGPSLITSST